MSWFKSDDSFHSHPKVRRLIKRRGGKAAGFFWLLCGTWSAQHETDGFIPDDVLDQFGYRNGAEPALILCEVGLWHRVEGGYVFHDWAMYQPTREENKNRRDKWAEDKRRLRKSVIPEQPMSKVDSTVDSNKASDMSKVDSTGSRPVPTRPIKNSGEVVAEPVVRATPATAERPPPPSEDRDARTAQSAWCQVLGEFQKPFVLLGDDAQHFHAILQLAVHERQENESLPAACRRIMRDFVAERVAKGQQITPRWCAEWCQKRAGTGGSGVQPKVRTREDVIREVQENNLRLAKLRGE